MGIDGIGGSRPLGPPEGVSPGEELGGTRSVGGTESTEGLGSVEGADAAGHADAIAEADRARLSRGELSVDEYLEIEVERATAHLSEWAPREVVELVRSELREQLAADPVLRSLAEQVTAQAR